MRYFFLDRVHVTDEMREWVKLHKGVIDDGSYPYGTKNQVANVPVIGLFIEEDDAAFFKLKFDV
jgi:hypothetical protein